MALNTAGLNAILDDGSEAPIYLAAGSGPLSTDQVSAARTLLTSTITAGVLAAASIPYAFTGTPGAAITHVLLFSAATGGTFYGSQALSTAAAFSGGGAFSLAGFTLAGSSLAATTPGLTALLDDGNEAPLYVGIGSAALASAETSTARVLLQLGAPLAGVCSALGLPYAFTGAAGAGATHALLFSALTGGTLRAAIPLTGGQAFSAAGGYNLTALSLTTGTAPIVPTAAYTRGVNVGVPTGTTLTTRSSLGSPTSSESYTITNPKSGETATKTYATYRNIRFTATITPAAGSPTTAIRFDQCSFEGTGNWCVEVDSAGRGSDIMDPLVVFTSCNFDGGGSGATSKCLLGGACWVIGCDMRNAEDGWSGWFYNVGVASNFLGFGATVDLHSDGVQCTDTGVSVWARSWFTTAGPGASQSFRVGTEAGATDDVSVLYCGLDGGGYAMQFRGDSGAGDITNITVIGCRWTRAHSFGPIDVEQTTGITWSDNAYFDNGQVIASP